MYDTDALTVLQMSIEQAIFIWIASEQYFLNTAWMVSYGILKLSEHYMASM